MPFDIIIVVFFVTLAIRAFMARGLPRVGGKIGRRQAMKPAEALPAGISGAYARSMRLSVASADAANFASQKDFLRRGTREIPTLIRIYRVAGCKTEIEIPAEPADYQRLDAGEALAMLRELPDPRLVRRLHISDVPCFLDPWVQKVNGRADLHHLGNANNFGLVALYRPDRRFRQDVALTVLHEWLHLVAFKHEIDLWRFGRAGRIEPLAPPPFPGINSGRARKQAHEAWAELGEKLLGYDETAAREAALTWPVHATILWRRIAKILRRVPRRLRGTRHAEFEARWDVVRTQVAPLAKARRRAR